MRGIIISQDQGTYLVSGDDGKRYQFATWDWSGKSLPKVGDSVDFVYEGDSINSVFPLPKREQAYSKLMLALICWFAGLFGVHRFIVGKVGTGVVMLILSLTIVGLLITGIWTIVDFIIILSGNFTDKKGEKITH